MPHIDSVSVFCGSSPGLSEVYRDSAIAFGRLLAENGIRLVYGGGGIGLMGAVADGALAAGGEVVGVIPTFLVERELEHKGLTETRVVGTMHERKQLMFELSQAACALAGGLGTLDEMIELVTWRQLNLHARPLVVINTDGYWDQLAALVDRAVDHGFAGEPTRDILTFVPTPEAAIALLKAFAPAPGAEQAGRL